MPILERDPWRFQYFEHAICPDDVLIPTDDPDAWALHPSHRWIYDKLRIAETQGLRCGPHGVAPPSYPVFSKPIVNLKGMGVGSRVIASPAEMDEAYRPGHMWMPLLEGPHVSSDCAVVGGAIRWLRHATGEPFVDGMFRHWTIHDAVDAALYDTLSRWAARHMAGYTGMMNFETIGGTIIEAHLRFADQWCDLYGDGWVEALIRLYETGKWHFADGARHVGYSVPLFASHGVEPRHPSAADQTAIRALPHVKSLQITFHESKDPDSHPMPPGGFRLGIVNATDLAAGRQARLKLAACFPGTSLLIPD
jgi:hypothetical protein